MRAPICKCFKGENLSVSLTRVHTSHVESQKKIKGRERQFSRALSTWLNVFLLGCCVHFRSMTPAVFTEI